MPNDDDLITASPAGDFLREQAARYRRRIPDRDGVQVLAYDLAVSTAADMVDGHVRLNAERAARWDAGEERDYESWHLIDDEVTGLLNLFHYWSFMLLPDGAPDPCDDEEVAAK